MYKILTRFAACNSPAAGWSRSRVLIISHVLFMPSFLATIGFIYILPYTFTSLSSSYIMYCKTCRYENYCLYHNFKTNIICTKSLCTPASAYHCQFCPKCLHKKKTIHAGWKWITFPIEAWRQLNKKWFSIWHSNMNSNHSVQSRAERFWKKAFAAFMINIVQQKFASGITYMSKVFTFRLLMIHTK